MAEGKRFIVSSALPYANGPLHLGHLAGAYIPADIFCRFQRLQGADVVYVCGSDEHGVPIMLRARKEGVTPQEIADRYHAMIEKAFEGLNFSFDHYSRTTSPVHHETSKEFFNKLDSEGAFKLVTSEQLYDPDAKLFLADRFVIGECPNCGNPEAYGDQCEHCGTALSPLELKNPKSTITDATPELRETSHWYLPLANWQEPLEKWIGTHPEWKAHVLGQIKSWLNDGLTDRAMTRDIPWGISVPEEAAKKAGVSAEGKVLYVWFDAPIGYISATREWAAKQGDPELWKKYWQDDDSTLLHFIGKDNIVFHCLIFPAMLMAHGDYVLPENVPANEFMNLEGKKLSTSRNWAVWVHEYLEELPPDLLRYAVATQLPETKDADFSWSDFQARSNSELADILGNFVNRTTTFCERYFDGVAPELSNPNERDIEALEAIGKFPASIANSYEQFRFREGVAETINLARLGNKYFNDAEPWHTRKTDMEACGNTIYVSLQICAALAIVLDPIIPESTARLREMLNMSGIRSSMPHSGDQEGALMWKDAVAGLIAPGHKIGTPAILFEKVPDEAIQLQLDKLAASAAANEPADANYEALKSEIVYDDFAKLDLRVGVVLEAEKVPKTDKLLRAVVDLGFEKRQILSGISEYISPEELTGMKVIVVANLAPRKIRGLESQGMILSAEDAEGNVYPVSGALGPGSTVE